MLDDALSGRMWPTGYGYKHEEVTDLGQAVEFVSTLPEVAGCVVVVPGAAFAAHAAQVNELLARMPWALVCVTSDEERRFPIEELSHPNMALWVQYPREDDVADGYLPVGYPPHFRELLPAEPPERIYDWVFAGQVNHARRRECVEALRWLPGVGCRRIEVSPGFTQGLGHAEYAELLSRARAVACPSGPESVDSFRVWEALEAGARPYADASTPHGDASWLWERVLGEHPPFTVVGDWASLPLFDSAEPTRHLSAWWVGWKRQWCQRLGQTIHDLSGVERTPDPVTVLIPTSPIAAHPDTSIIEQTIASVRFHHPTAEVVVMCDGVRPEQEHYRERYSEYLNRLCWLAARDGRILPLVYEQHLHQAEMTRSALDHVESPLILFVEHDTPLVTDEPIDWPALQAACLSEVDLVRFHYEAMVHPEHEHLMLDTDPRDVHGAPLLRTVQWSQRPHLANTGWYRKVINDNFPPGYKGMLEDVLHGVVHNEWRQWGKAGWDRYRLAMYAPAGNLKRSLHLDGRGEDPKWEMS